jgi:hypothetical protein
MKLNQILIVLAFASVGCSSNVSRDQDNVKTSTPDVLQETRPVSIKFSKESGRSNLIDLLYSEALSHDSALNQLDREIGFLAKQSFDSLADWRDYSDKNAEFFDDAKFHLQAIRDTNLRKEGRAFLDDIIGKQKDRVGHLYQLDSNIQRDDRALRDFHNLLKLVVANNLMENYRRNEMPKAETFERILERHEVLTGKTKPAIKERK